MNQAACASQTESNEPLGFGRCSERLEVEKVEICHKNTKSKWNTEYFRCSGGAQRLVLLSFDMRLPSEFMSSYNSQGIPSSLLRGFEENTRFKERVHVPRHRQELKSGAKEGRH